jgi:DNA gyrase/topoisomerase IV subunit A
MGSAEGVRAIKLSKGDFVVCAETVLKEANLPTLMIMSSNGFGKRSDVHEHNLQFPILNLVRELV